MKISRFLFINIISMIVLFACSGKGSKQDKVAKVRPEKIQMNGDLMNYLEVVDNEYEIIDDFGGKLSIRVKAIQALPEDKHDSELKITASILGENSMPVSGIGDFVMSKSSMEKVSSLLKKGVGEEIIELTSDITQYDDSKHAAKSKKFIVSGYFKTTLNSDPLSEQSEIGPGSYYSNEERVYFHNSPDESTRRNAYILKGEPVDITKVENDFGYTVFTSTANKTSSGWLKMSELSKTKDDSNQETTSLDNEDPADNAGGQTADCEKFLRDYEAFVNSYIRLYKKYKANPSDVTIIEEYNDAARQALEMENNISVCTDTKFASRLLDLQNKLAKALL
jgi:hypothetical protein